MPREKRQFENDELYHITLRRIADEPLFLDTNDHYRGVFSIYEFNNSDKVSIARRRRDRDRFKSKAKSLVWGQTPYQLVRGLTPYQLAQLQGVPQAQTQAPMVEPDKRKKMVEVLSFVLMPNHLHLILRQLKLIERGISRYMQKSREFDI